MKSPAAYLGILAIGVGTVFGVVNWYLVEFYLETVDWEGPVVEFNKLTWLLNILGFGIGGVLIGIAAINAGDSSSSSSYHSRGDSFAEDRNPFRQG